MYMYPFFLYGSTVVDDDGFAMYLVDSDQSHCCFLVLIFLVCEIKGWMWMIPKG